MLLYLTLVSRHLKPRDGHVMTDVIPILYEEKQKNVHLIPGWVFFAV